MTAYGRRRLVATAVSFALFASAREVQNPFADGFENEDVVEGRAAAEGVQPDVVAGQLQVVGGEGAQMLAPG